MEMYDPPSPGEFIREVYLESAGLSCEACAQASGIALPIMRNILDGTAGITPELAKMLSHGLGSSPESWLRLQEIHDVWLAKVAAASNVAN
jgi:addiction module HigA family antidote